MVFEEGGLVNRLKRTFSISPHGVLEVALGMGMMFQSSLMIESGNLDSGTNLALIFEFVTGVAITGIGGTHIYFPLDVYKHHKKNIIKNSKLSEKMCQFYFKKYCHRQSLFNAALDLNRLDYYEDVKERAGDVKQQFSWLPEVYSSTRSPCSWP